MNQGTTPSGDGLAENKLEPRQAGTLNEDVPPQPARHVIVGIGASAGGLAAFQAFFTAMPADSGMAFVLVQHLDPDYESTLAEILTGFTTMPVVKAADGTVAAPNTVSVIPPNCILKIEQGVLRVAMAESVTARRSSVDTFLISLAEDWKEDAVGIILSGYGSDGTNGIAAIKEYGGLTLSEAEFDHHAKMGMPQSAVAGGFVDQVLRAQDMPSALLAFQRCRKSLRQQKIPNGSDPDFDKQLSVICAILQSRLGRDFTDYKTNTLVRRVLRRMQILRIADMGNYIEQLRTLPDEAELLFRELLIGVTRFFRDAAMFETVAQAVSQILVSKRVNSRDPVRVWAAGCATGEEAYSIAILFKEALLRTESTQRVKIFATDIDERAIAFARSGLYSDVIEGDITAERLAQNFSKEGAGYRVAKQIREMCVFSTHDLTKDPPFSNLDLVSCRNLLIYFEARLQKRVLATFHYSLKSTGLLWLGPSEAVANTSPFFKWIDKKCRLFRRVDIPVELPRTAAREIWSKPVLGAAQPEIKALEDEINQMLATFAPAYVIVDARLEIHRFSGPIAKFLEPVSGSAKLNLSRLLHSELRSPAAMLVRKAAEDQRRIEETLTVDLADKPMVLNLVAAPVSVPVGGERGVLLCFQEIKTMAWPLAETRSLNAGVFAPEIERELLGAREKLQAVTEELATANEELQSSNEEFQSVNEELHSTVEELETSKEELQSINEELQTVNSELNSRADSLARANSDLINLFESTPLATLFLDTDCRIRRFTPATTEIFNIREGDEGRPLTDFSSRLTVGTITQEVRAVLQTLESVEREVESDDGLSTYLLRIRPYRTTSNVIDGVVTTFVDISERKRFERDRAYLAAIVQSSQDAIISHDLDGRITSWNGGAEAIYGYDESEMTGQPMSVLLDESQLDEWPVNLARLRLGESIGIKDESRIAKNHRRIDVSLTISPIRNDHGVIIGASALARDVSDRKAGEQRAEMLMAELDHRVKNILAVVSAVISQTFSAGEPVNIAKTEIEGRISAIARAQGLLTGRGGVEMAFKDLIATELAPYENHRIKLSGDDIRISSKTAVILALALHELATNAAKYGALSVASGLLEVNWRVTIVDGMANMLLIWEEKSGPPVKPPSRRGFGTKLIELSLVRGLGATVNREFLAGGVRCQIQIPLAEDIGRVRSDTPSSN